MGTDAYWEPGPYLLEDFAHELVEHLCHLDQLPLSGFRFSAPFLRIQGGASFPVRAFAELGQR
jgi:kynurenine formamidase